MIHVKSHRRLTWYAFALSLLAIILGSLLVGHPPLSADAAEDDKAALIAFYNATDGGGWTNPGGLGHCR